jgi:hypothetical protein
MSEPSARQARQAEALRANLARRKAQSRARADAPPPAPASPDESGAVSSDSPPPTE